MSHAPIYDTCTEILLNFSPTSSSTWSYSPGKCQVYPKQTAKISNWFHLLIYLGLLISSYINLIWWICVLVGIFVFFSLPVLHTVFCLWIIYVGEKDIYNHFWRLNKKWKEKDLSVGLHTKLTLEVDKNIWGHFFVGCFQLQ